MTKDCASWDDCMRDIEREEPQELEQIEAVSSRKREESKDPRSKKPRQRIRQF